jgi:hypothetical protein
MKISLYLRTDTAGRDKILRGGKYGEFRGRFTGVRCISLDGDAALRRSQRRRSMEDPRIAVRIGAIYCLAIYVGAQHASRDPPSVFASAWSIKILRVPAVPDSCDPLGSGWPSYRVDSQNSTYATSAN